MSSRRRKKAPREKDLTSRYMSGGMDEDRVEQQERFTPIAPKTPSRTRS